MDRFFIKMFQRRETPGVPKTTDPNSPTNQPKATGGSYDERIERPRSPEAALTISAVYRAVELRAKTEAQFQMQYQRVSREGGNFIPDMWGPGKKLNYLLQVEPNPLMTWSSLIEQVVIDRLQKGNGFIFIERDEFGDPRYFWLAQCGGYDETSGRYTLTYLSENGVRFKFETDRRNVLHFPNTFRDYGGFWGIPTLRYAIDTLSLIKTENRQTLETAAKGGRVKLLLSEDTSKQYSPIAGGMFNKSTGKKYATEINDEIYRQDVVALRGLDKVTPISMTSQEMQMIELLGMSLDDVARFWATPRPLLMLDTNSHYTTPTNATMEYMMRTIQPEVIEIEQEFQRKILTPEDFGRRRFHMCEQPLLRLDKETQAKVDKMHLEAGWSPNEIRAQYDLPSIPDGDRHYLSTNLAELGSQKLRGNDTNDGQGAGEGEGA